MKSKITRILFLLSLCLFRCDKSTEFFVGKWQILNVIENNESVELMDNWMHLKDNGTFISYDGELRETETGIWHYENKTGELIIDGEGDSEDSSWYLQMKNDTLIFRSTNNMTYLNAVKF